MVAAIQIGHVGAMLTLLPVSGATRTKAVTDEVDARLDKRIGRYVLRVACLRQLDAACTKHGVELHPSRSLEGFLSRYAQQLRATEEFSKGLTRQLYPYQNAGAAFLYGNPAAILADDMGLGKTIQALHAIPKGAATLVVCPGFLANNWRDETAKWRPDVDVGIVSTAATWRWPNPGEILICSYGKLPAAPDKFGRPEPGTHLIADEAQSVKSYKAQRTRNFRKLQRRVAKVGGLTWLLTGTPIMNRPSELWALLQAMDLGKTCYGAYDNFVKLFGGVKNGLGAIDWTGAVSHEAMRPVEPYILRRVKRDVLPDLPRKTRRSLCVSPPKAALRKALDSLQGEWGDLLQRSSEAWEESHWQALVSARRALAEAKIPDLLMMLPDYEDAGQPLVVFSAHRAPIEALQGRPGWGTILGGTSQQQRADNVKAFQAEELRGLACTIGAAGLGLTLTAASNAIFVDLDWVPANNVQAEDRLCRIGQTRGVQITHLTCDHKVDHAINATLRSKMELLDKTTERLNVQHVESSRLELAGYLESIAAGLRD